MTPSDQGPTAPQPALLRFDPGTLPESLRTGLLGEGAPFELREEEVLGTTCRCFVHRAPNVTQVLARSARERGGLDYLVGSERTVSLAATATAAARIGRRLRDDFGVQPGDRVAVAAASSLAHATAWWGIAGSGAIAASLNGWWAPPELAYGIELASPKLVMADAPRRERLRRAGLGGDVPLVDLDELVADAWSSGGTADDLTDLPGAARSEDDPLAILFTSGTTGRPKGAVISQRNVVHVTMAVALGAAITLLSSPSPLPPTDGQPGTILASPLFHVSGLLPLVVGAYAGTKLVVPPPGPWDETRHLELTQRHGVTSWSGVPTQIWRLLEHRDLDRYDLSRLRTIGGGGAMFPPELRQLATSKLPGVELGTGYGMTETFGSGARLHSATAASHPASVGTVEPASEIRVVAPDGTPLPDGEVGEICIRSAAVFLGYWNDPEATAAALDGQRWYHSGDFGRIRDHVLYLESRVRDLIIRGGENIYPIEIENRLLAHPDVEDACVVGVDHPRLGQEVAAVVVARPDADLPPQEVRDWVATALAAFKVPAHVLLRPELPYTETGKLVKHRVEADVRHQLATAERM